MRIDFLFSNSQKKEMFFFIFFQMGLINFGKERKKKMEEKPLNSTCVEITTSNLEMLFDKKDKINLKTLKWNSEFRSKNYHILIKCLENPLNEMISTTYPRPREEKCFFFHFIKKNKSFFQSKKQ